MSAEDKVEPLSEEEINDLDVLLQLEKAMSAGKVQELPNKEEIHKATRAARAAKDAQDAANSLKAKARVATDPKERERLLREAYRKEVEAHGQSKTAQRMASGAWQGAAGGAGIGAGVGVGLGTVVGSLVGGVVSLPTAGLGALVGTGVGAVHGPWIKMDESDANTTQPNGGKDNITPRSSGKDRDLATAENGDGGGGEQYSDRATEDKEASQEIDDAAAHAAAVQDARAEQRGS